MQSEAARRPHAGHCHWPALWRLLLLLRAATLLGGAAQAGAEPLAGQPHEVVVLSDLSGTIGGGNNSAVCAWHISPGVQLLRMEFWPRTWNFAGSDYLLFYALGVMGSRVLTAAYSGSEPMPPGFMLTGLDQVLVVLQAQSANTFFEIDYDCQAEPRGVDLMDQPLSAFVLAALLVLACSSVIICCYVVCFWRAKRRMQEALQASQVVLRMDLPSHLREITQQLREAEERMAGALDVLPTQRWQGPAVGVEQDDEEECCLCLEAYKRDDVLRILPCRHFYHKDCIDRWFASRRYMPRSCPLCKRNPLAGETGPSDEAARRPSTGSAAAAVGGRRQSPAGRPSPGRPAEAWGQPPGSANASPLARFATTLGRAGSRGPPAADASGRGNADAGPLQVVDAA